MLRMAWPGSAWLAAAHAAAHRSRGPPAGAGLPPRAREEGPRLSGCRAAATTALRCLPKVADPTAFGRAGDEPDQATKDLGPLFRKILDLPSTRSLQEAAQLGPLGSGTPRYPCVSWGLHCWLWAALHTLEERPCRSEPSERPRRSDAEAFTHLQARAPISTAHSSCRSQTSPTTTSSAGSASAASARA